MAKKASAPKAITDEQRKRARVEGQNARRLRGVGTCPYTAGSELAEIWRAACFPRPVAKLLDRPVEEKAPVETVIDRLKKSLGASN
jgi:hypothetical protein